MVSGSSVAPSQSHWPEHTQQQRQSMQRQGTVGEQWSSRQILASTVSAWYSAGDIICNYCNHTLYVTMSVGELESLVLPGPQALAPVSKHLPHLGCRGLCACQ